MPRLVRTRDGAGDLGGLSMIFRLNPDTSEVEFLDNQRPRLGWRIRVGSITSRMFGNQDYWSTTEVIEIVEEKEGYVKFKTSNSDYEWFS